MIDNSWDSCSNDSGKEQESGGDVMAINAVGSRVSRAVSCALMLGTFQAVVQAAESNDELAEVVVSGSRVITDGFSSPTPITVLTAEQMQLTAPTSLSDAINQLPQFRASYTPATTGFAATANAGNGGAFANLRGLNPKRVLILLNGARVVQSQANGGIAGAVDLN